MIIEVLGPSGIGKTTIIELLAAEVGVAGFCTAKELVGRVAGDKIVGKDFIKNAVDTIFSESFICGSARILLDSNYGAASKLLAMRIFDSTIREYARIISHEQPLNLLHDELLLHRGMTMLARSSNVTYDARWYYRNVHLPDAAIIFRANPDVVLERILGLKSSVTKNIYFGLDELGVKEAVERQLAALDIAHTELGKYIPVYIVDANGEKADVLTSLKNAFEMAVGNEGNPKPLLQPRNLSIEASGVDVHRFSFLEFLSNLTEQGRLTSQEAEIMRLHHSMELERLSEAGVRRFQDRALYSSQKLSQCMKELEVALSENNSHQVKAKEYLAQHSRDSQELKRYAKELEVARSTIDTCQISIKEYSDRCVQIASVNNSLVKLGDLREAYLRSSLSYQSARAILVHIKSPLGLIKLPLALLRVLKRYRRGKGKRAAMLEEIQRRRHRLNNAIRKVKPSANKKGDSRKAYVKLGGSLVLEKRDGWGAIADICNIAQAKSSKSLFSTVLRTGSLQGRDLLAYLASQGGLNTHLIVLAVEACRDHALAENGRETLRSLLMPWAVQLAQVMASQRYEPDDELNAFTLLWVLFDLHGKKALSHGAIELMGALAVSLGKKKELQDIAPFLRSERLPSAFLRIDSCHPNFGGDRDAWLGEINQFLNAYDLEPITLSESEEGFSGINCHVADEARSGPLVTVIITAWRPDECLFHALRSILNQSWNNLEVLVVDDASGEDYRSVFDACEALDSRVRVLRQPFNQGTYQARNAGLRIAQGKYVTFQDSDDWSHPRRVELQLRALEDDPDLVFCHSYCLRVSEDLVFTGHGNAVYTKNTSSLMFDRQPVLERVGYMDAVRKSADTEYGLRMGIEFGEGSSCEINKPLAFVRMAPGSLSRAEFRPGWQHPARLAYKSIYRHWHERIKAGLESAYFDGTVDSRRFPAPLRLQVDKAAAGKATYDVVFVGDWRSYGGPQKSMIEEIKALHAKGLSIAICMLEAYRFMTYISKDLCGAINELIYEGIVDQVVPDDDIDVRLVVLRYPPILQWIPYGSVSWKIGVFWVVANQAPHELDGRDIRYHVSDCIRNARQFFGQDALWVPQGPQVRQALEPLLPAALIASFNNPGIIDTDEWKVGAQGWRSKVPIVGRYSRDNLMKFPSTVQVMSAAYMAEKDVVVRIMGGQRSIPALFAETAIPANWEVMAYGAVSVTEFLSSIDFFVYFDNELIVEAFGRSILEAIAAGVVVVLPPHFRSVFGDAAVYCEAGEVFEVVSRFYASRKLYDEQVSMAMRCLRETFSYESFYQRVAGVIKAEALC